MRTLAMLACLLVAGCAQKYTGPTAAQISQECGVGSKPFVDTWPCVRAGIAPLPADADIKAVYIASGDFVVEQVQAGKMTDAEAKLAMAQVEQRAKREALDRENAAAQRSGNAAINAAVLGSIMNRPTPFDTPPPVFGPRMTCTRYGNTVSCY